MTMTMTATPRPAAMSEPAVSCFSVEGDADPGLLPRVLELFAKRGLVPERFFAQQGRHGPRSLTIDLQVAGFSAHQRDLVAQSLRQIPLVTAVLTSEKVAA